MLAQPTLTAQRATSFIPFSFEVGDDWGSIRVELAKLIANAKGVLTTTQRVLTSGAGAIAVGDIYSLKQSIGSTRFQAGATWLLNSNRLDAVFRLTPAGSTTEPQVMSERNGTLLGRPVAEVSTMATATPTGSKWSVYGDIKAGYVIGERLGLSVELIPHLSEPRIATRQGSAAVTRSGGMTEIKAANALRYGEVL